MSLKDSQFVANLVMECVAFQARGRDVCAERVWFELVGILGELEALARINKLKAFPGQELDGRTSQALPVVRKR